MTWFACSVADKSKGSIANVTKDESSASFPFPCEDTTDCTHYIVTVVPGEYKLEVWGAQGGNDTTYPSQAFGGRGGYSKGFLKLTTQTKLYIYVGGSGSGEKGHGRGSTGGGGSTDIRVQSGIWNYTDSLHKRIIVAGGGGGRKGEETTDFLGNDGGGEIAPSFTSFGYTINGATQSSGGSSNLYLTDYIAVGSFGFASPNPHTEMHYVSKGGYNGGSYGSEGFSNGGAGGGWWGGCTSAPTGSGGSGFVYTSSNYQCTAPETFMLTDAETFSGNVEFESPYGGTEVGHRGNGFARITLLIELPPPKQTKDFFRVVNACSSFFVDRKRRWFITFISIFMMSLFESETPSTWSVPDLVLI